MASTAVASNSSPTSLMALSGGSTPSNGRRRQDDDNQETASNNNSVTDSNDDDDDDASSASNNSKKAQHMYGKQQTTTSILHNNNKQQQHARSTPLDSGNKPSTDHSKSKNSILLNNGGGGGGSSVNSTSSHNANTNINNPSFVLSGDLRRILVEVTKTGVCCWLPWDHPGAGVIGGSSAAAAVAAAAAAGKDSQVRGTESTTGWGGSPCTSGGVTPTSTSGGHQYNMPPRGLSGVPSPASFAAMAKLSLAISNNYSVAPYYTNLVHNVTTPTTHYPQAFSTHRRSGVALGPKPPTRKKHRKNGRHGNANFRQSSGGRKRPLVLNKTPSNASPGAPLVAGPPCGSVGSSGRASGSEMDDSTQYECDSEGTSATTNSEISLERSRSDLSLRGKQMRGGQNTTALASLKMGYTTEDATVVEEESTMPIHYKTLQEAVRVAIGLVLDHYYRRRGGYKLSPAEKRRNATLEANSAIPSANGKNSMLAATRPTLSPEAIFQQRRERLLLMLISPESDNEGWVGKPRGEHTKGPPFTVQRIAEVLLTPERYYTQTHKLCNCLEKLLLVTSSTRAFGGSTGGDTSQSRREERELAALADEKGRLESELRQRRVKRTLSSSPTDELLMEGNGGGHDMPPITGEKHGREPSLDRDEASPSKKAKHESPRREGSAESSSRELLEAAARASLRHKFDHVGIDPHLSSGANRDVRAISESRGMTKSPPPPSLAMSTPNNVGLSGHSGVTGFVRQHHPEQGGEHHNIGRLHTPLLLSPNSGSNIHSAHNVHVLQMHHAAGLAGIPERGSGSSPLELVSYNHNNGSPRNGQSGSEAHDPEIEHGRSSASNSDVDSESDDVSFDDSASDRSDGSDSGSLTHYEPFSPARAMALNRMQQQQRLQSRVFTSLSALHPNDPSYRPPADSEYQSGDSIDSTRAEDSGGSDSSSSDLAD